MTDHSRPDFSWQVHPARERRGAAVATSLIILAVAGAVWASVANWAWAALAVVLLLVGLNRFFFPSRFTIDESGITAKYPLRTLRYRWEDLRRFVCDRHGGYLSTRSRRSRLDAYRGMHLLFGRDREAVIGQIRARLAPGGPPCEV